MKKGIHPNYGLTEVTCACGATFVTRSTRPVVKLDICSSCHPFFTGQQRLLDIAGRVDKFNKRFAATNGKTVIRKPKTAKPAGAVTTIRKVLSTTPAKAAAATAKAEKGKKAEHKAEKKADSKAEKKA